MIDSIAENIKYCSEHWYEKVIEQEKVLRFNSFTRENALELGNIICKISKEKYNSEVAVKIIMDGLTVFSHLMGETGLKNDWYMTCKYNTVLKNGTSSLMALIERSIGIKPFEDWCYQKMNYILCGGAFPIYSTNDEFLGCILVSALAHECDHQLIVDALSEMLDIKVPKIEKYKY